MEEDHLSEIPTEQWKILHLAEYRPYSNIKYNRNRQREKQLEHNLEEFIVERDELFRVDDHEATRRDSRKKDIRENTDFANFPSGSTQV